MKTQLKSFVCAIALITFMSVGMEAIAKNKGATVSIKTSAVCESCKKRIEKAVLAVEGVEKASLNLGNKEIKVKYDPAKTSPEKIRSAVSGTGYDADDVKKNEQAYTKLPHCCQKTGECKH